MPADGSRHTGEECGDDRGNGSAEPVDAVRQIDAVVDAYDEKDGETVIGNPRIDGFVEERKDHFCIRIP